MSGSSRLKGRKAEAAVRAIYESHGFTVRGLEGRGDHLALGHGLTIHSEVKRQEVLRLPLWTRQAVSEAPPGAIPVLAYRRSRDVWRAPSPEWFVSDLLAWAGRVAGVDFTILKVGQWWFVAMPLEELLAGLVHGVGSAEPQEALS